MSGELKVGGSSLVSDSGGTGALTWGSGLPSGSIVQVQNTQYTAIADMSSMSANTDYVLCDDTAGSGTEILTVNITPKITGSKMWLQCSWSGEFDSYTNARNSTFFLWRGTTKLGAPGSSGAINYGIMPPSINHGSDDDSTMENCFFQYFDTHGISAGTQITYKMGVRVQSAGGVKTNSTVDQSTTTHDYERTVSSIVAIEIAP